MSNACVKRKNGFASIFLFIGFCVSSLAASDIWKSSAGLEGRGFDAMTVDASGSVYAGAYNGIYKSTNGGDTWSLANRGVKDLQVKALASDNHGTVYLGTTTGSLFKSTNGSSWTRIGKRFPNMNITAMLADANGAVYIGTYGNGVFVSRNGGASWSQSNNGLKAYDLEVNSLAADASGTVYVGTGTGIFKRPNNSSSWTAVSNGLPYDIFDRPPDIRALTVDKDGMLYAGTLFFGIFKSTDGGENWTAINVGLDVVPGKHVTVLAVDTKNGVFAGTYGGGGMFVSRNGGNTWTLEDMTDVTINALAVDSKGVVYAGTGGGIYRNYGSEAADKRQ